LWQFEGGGLCDSWPSVARVGQCSLIPGHVTVEALFPKGRELDTIERFALSVGLSLALVPLVGLLLNYTPWGIRLNPIVVSLNVLTVGLAMFALAREYRLSTGVSRAYGEKSHIVV